MKPVSHREGLGYFSWAACLPDCGIAQVCRAILVRLYVGLLAGSQGNRIENNQGDTVG